MKTSITFLKSNVSREETVAKIEKTDTDFIHVDIMDGHFVDRTVLTIEETKSLFKNSIKPLDIHLMCENPLEYIKELSSLNVAFFTIHAEINHDINEIIDYIHSRNIKAGLAIKIETSVSDIAKYLNSLEQVLIMGIIPGYGGQKLTLSTVNKIEELKNLKERFNYHYEIALDGGVNLSSRPLLEGLDIIVAGSYVCESDDYQEKINTLR